MPAMFSKPWAFHIHLFSPRLPLSMPHGAGRMQGHKVGNGMASMPKLTQSLGLASINSG
jgi:hypothetical protein